MAAPFTPTPRTRVKRLHERGRYDRETVHAILDSGVICHVGYVIEGQPYVTTTSYWRHGDRLYWHGSSASRMLRHLKQEVPVCPAICKRRLRRSRTIVQAGEGGQREAASQGTTRSALIRAPSARQG